MNRRLHSYSLSFSRCAALAYALAPLLGVFFTTQNLLLIFCISRSFLIAHYIPPSPQTTLATSSLSQRTIHTYKSLIFSNRHRHWIFENSTSLHLSGHDRDTPSLLLVQCFIGFFKRLGSSLSCDSSVRPLTSYNYTHRFQHISSLSWSQSIFPASHIITLAPFSPFSFPFLYYQLFNMHSYIHHFSGILTFCTSSTFVSPSPPAFSSHKTPPIASLFWIATSIASIHITTVFTTPFHLLLIKIFPPPFSRDHPVASESPTSALLSSF